MNPTLRKLLETTPRAADLALFVVRLGFGAMLAIVHGLGKVTDIGGFANKIADRVPAAAILGPAAALAEFFGGLLVAIGLFTRPAAAFVATTMGVAAFFIHRADPFAKKELALTYFFAALAVIVAGAGRLSVDHWLLVRQRPSKASDTHGAEAAVVDDAQRR